MASARSAQIASFRIVPTVEAEPICENGIFYKVADSQQEWTGAFRLVYENYIRAGLMHPNPFQMRVMPYHLLPSTTVFVAIHDELVVATMSLVGDGRFGLPMEGVYGNEVNELRRPYKWLAEVSSLASAPTGRLGRDAVIRLMQMTAQTSRRQGIDHLLVAVHPRHARFYQRAMGFQPLGDEKAYPTVCGHPAIALQLDLSNVEIDRPDVCDLLFGQPIPEALLRFCPISAAERRLFAPAAAYDTSLPDSSTAPITLACA